MKVLVTAGSRHGSTLEIAEITATVLRRAGLAVDVRDAAVVDQVLVYDAVVLGSAVYVGSWTDSARALVDRFEADLRTQPVWLFSSGPLGHPPVPEEGPREVAELVARTRARGHVVLPGRLDRASLSLGERAVTRMVRAPYGDFRDWGAVMRWAEDIAGELVPAQA